MNADPQVQAIAEAFVQALAITNTRTKQVEQTSLVNSFRRKDVTFNANTQYAHGPSGVFNQPGVNRDVWALVPRPMGLASRLPFVATQYMNEFYELLLPVTAGSGSEPANDCAPGPNPGNATVGFQYYPFGKTIRTTQVIDVNRVGQLLNVAEPVDLNVINSIASESPFTPDPARNPNIMNSELGKQYFTLGMEFERVMEGETFTGNHSSNSPATLGKLFFDGLTVLVNTGKIDAKYGSPLTSLNSLLVNWNNAFYNGTVTLNGQVADIVTTLSSMLNYLQARARVTRSLPVQWAIVLRYDLFYALTAVWPCSYLTNACTTASASNLVAVNGNDQVAMRDEMRQSGNEFLWINGNRVPVIITDQIAETTSGGKRVSDIFFLPLTAAGRSTLYYEYFDYNNGMISDFTSLVPGQMWTSNGGMYFWNVERTRYCLDLTAKLQSRLILRRSDLAARLQNVGYNAYIPTNTSGPSDLYALPAGVGVGDSGSGLYIGD